MKLIAPESQILLPPGMSTAVWRESIYRLIEAAGRNCYRSEPAQTTQGAEDFVRKIVRAGHDAMLEHVLISVQFTVDRGITHELVRHRMASFAQESTRYCNYGSEKFGGGIRCVSVMGGIAYDPAFATMSPHRIELILAEFTKACSDAEAHYLAMLELGCSPQIARSVLPTATASGILVTANVREWRHIFELRALGTTGQPHPQMREVMVPLLKRLAEILPACFDDLAEDLARREKEIV